MFKSNPDHFSEIKYIFRLFRMYSSEENSDPMKAYRRLTALAPMFCLPTLIYCVESLNTAEPVSFPKNVKSLLKMTHLKLHTLI